MHLYLFNKPFRVLSQFTDDAGRATLADYIDVPGIYSIGRLDYDSEGLLLLTADGKLKHRIGHPRFALEKSYWVQVEGLPNKAALEDLVRGVTSRGERLRAVAAERIEPPEVWRRDPPIRERKSVPDCWLNVTLTEGRNRQVRRMTAAVGHPTLRLIRHRVGPWELRGLEPGEWVKLPVGAASGRDSLGSGDPRR